MPSMTKRPDNTISWVLILACPAVFLLIGCESIHIETPQKPRQEQPADLPYTDPPCPDGKCPYQAGPIQHLERELRTPNYGDDGSCGYAAMQDVLIVQGKDWIARQVGRRYYGGMSVGDAKTMLRRLDLQYACTTTGETEFLEWCSRTRRPACIFYDYVTSRRRGRHAVTFCGFEAGNAVLIDNNATAREKRVPKAYFLKKWQSDGRSYGHRGGIAFTVVGTPAPPAPRQSLVATTLFVGGVQ